MIKKNRMLNTLAIFSTATLFSISMVPTASADGVGGYAMDGSGRALKDGSGRCVTALWGHKFEGCGVTVAQPILKPAPVVVVPPPKAVVVIPPPKPVVQPKPIVKVLTLNETGGSNFAFDSDDLSARAQNTLANFANNVKSSKVTPSSVSVVGHTDSIGKEAYNQKLSERRANSVANYLASQGINRRVMQVSGRGELQPVASNKTKTGRAENRRVDIRVTGQRKVIIRR